MRRFYVMFLMTSVMVAAICFKGYLEWDRRHGSGSQCWLAAIGALAGHGGRVASAASRTHVSVRGGRGLESGD